MSTLELDTFKNKSPELLVDLSEQCAAVLQEMLDIDADRAAHIGRHVAEHMSSIWGGQNIYFPKGVIFKLTRRDRQIFSEFTGTNHADLARRYGVSLQWIYKIIKAVRLEEISRRQGSLLKDE